MNEDDFLKVASDLLASSGQRSQSGAAHVRSAISRSYYAAFHSGRKVITEAGMPSFRGGGGHQMVIDVFIDCENQEMKSWGHELNNLKGARNDADYTLEKKDVEDVKTAEFYLQSAATLVENFSGVNAKINQWIDLCDAVKRYRAIHLKK